MIKKLMFFIITLVSILGLLYGLTIIELIKISLISLGIYIPILIVKDQLNHFLKFKNNEEDNKEKDIKKSNKIEEEKKQVKLNVIRHELLNETLEKDKVLIKKRKPN